jgi:hypothetical protein
MPRSQGAQVITLSDESDDEDDDGIQTSMASTRVLLFDFIPLYLPFFLLFFLLSLDYAIQYPYWLLQHLKELSYVSLTHCLTSFVLVDLQLYKP